MRIGKELIVILWRDLSLLISKPLFLACKQQGLVRNVPLCSVSYPPKMAHHSQDDKEEQKGQSHESLSCDCHSKTKRI
jgi:hypothetical protein